MKQIRRYFRIQFRLSTAIVMMFVAGGILWANSIDRMNIELKEEWREHGLDVKYFGWPMQAIYIVAKTGPNENFIVSNPFEIHSSWWRVSIVLCALVILAITGALNEFIILRRSRA